MLRSSNSISKTRFWIIIAFTLFIHIILAYRFFQLQILDYDIYTKRSNSNRIRAISIPAPRGLIRDRKGEIIVDNYPTYVLFGIGGDIVNKENNYSVISKATGIDTLILSKNYNKNFRNRFLPTKLAKDLTIAQLSRLEESKNMLTGVIYKQFPERIFNPKIRASHVLGYLKEVSQDFISSFESSDKYQHGDLIGWSGLEKQYESILRGKKGVSYFQVDVFGREAGKVREEENSLPHPGKDIYTTLDIELQELLEAEFEGAKGAGVVSNARTGGILAYVSAPDYTPDLFTGLISQKDWEFVLADTNKPLLDRVANGTYPPGSIYKMIVALELLENKKVTKEWEVFCTGSYEFYDRVFHCWSEFGHGKVNLQKAIVESCDIYFYQAIQNVDLNSLGLMAEEFGHGNKTQIDLPSEMKGRVPTRGYLNKLYGRYGWSEGAMLNISIGQGELLTTPLQISLYTNILATKGITYPLHLVPSKSKLINIKKITDANWNFIQESMERVIYAPRGTGRKANPEVKGLKIAGKTGTAENPHGETHAWFIGYGEKDGEKISVVIMVENGGGGGDVAAPIAKNIFKKYFNSNDFKTASK